MIATAWIVTSTPAGTPRRSRVMPPMIAMAPMASPASSRRASRKDSSAPPQNANTRWVRPGVHSPRFCAPESTPTEVVDEGRSSRPSGRRIEVSAPGTGSAGRSIGWRSAVIGARSRRKVAA
jgi:hypothetical protein